MISMVSTPTMDRMQGMDRAVYDAEVNRLATAPIDAGVFQRLMRTNASVKLAFLGYVESLKMSLQADFIEDSDPGDEQPAPDYEKILDEAIDAALTTQHPSGAGRGEEIS